MEFTRWHRRTIQYPNVTVVATTTSNLIAVFFSEPFFICQGPFFFCFGLITSRFFPFTSTHSKFYEWLQRPTPSVNRSFITPDRNLSTQFVWIGKWIPPVPTIIDSHGDDDLRTSSCIGGAVAWFQPSPTTGRGGTRIRTAGERTQGAVVYGSHMVPCQLTPVNLTV